MPEGVERELVGRVLGGRYRVIRVIGHGGMGTVYEAHQLDLDRRVAVKVLSPTGGQSLARLRKEAATAGALRSPHVVAVLDWQEPPGEPPFLVMELLEGASLASVLVREGRLAPQRATRIVMQMLAALDVAHRAGLVHRDVKPSNVWLTQTLAGEVAKLLDFGIVKSDDPTVQHTTVGAIIGTPAYLAPEQVRGGDVGPRADLHAVGVVAWEMLTGTRLWSASNVFGDILERVPPRVDTIVPGVPPVLAEVVARALAKDPDARFRSAEEMLLALAPVVDSGAFDAPAPSPALGSAPAGHGTTEVTRPPEWTSPSAPLFHSHSAAPLPTSPAYAPPAPPASPAPPAPAPPTSTPPPHPSHAKPTSGATSNTTLFAIVVVTVLVLGGAIAAVTTVLVGRARDAEARGAPTAPTAPTAIASPDPSLAPAPDPLDGSASPTPDALDASPDPRVADPRVAAATPSATPTPAPRPAPALSKCRCIARVSTLAVREVCQTPSPPSCACRTVPDDGVRICAKPFPPDGTCTEADRHDVYSKPGAKGGQPCKGYYDEGRPKPGTLVEGVLECDFCYGAQRFGRGIQGGTCRGYSKLGELFTGHWECDEGR